LAFRYSSDWASRRRVSAGSMMSSTSLRPAETYGEENVERY
jgi:hypothetical protein